MASVNISIATRNGRQQASSGSKWEPVIGYSRAVKAGNLIFVTGTVGVNADGTYPQGIAAQAKRSLEIIRAAIEALGGKMTDVVRTRMFVSDISLWEELGKVHGEVFKDIRPATTMVQVAKLIDGPALVEIEADAVVG